MKSKIACSMWLAAAMWLAAWSMAAACGEPEEIVYPHEVRVGQTFEIRLRHAGKAEDEVHWGAYTAEKHMWHAVDGRSLRFTSYDDSPPSIPVTEFNRDRWTWLHVMPHEPGKISIFPNYVCGNIKHLLQLQISIKPLEAVYLPLLMKPPAESFEVPLP